MKLSEIRVGATVQVRRGFTVRTAVVEDIRPNGTVSVSYVYTAAERASFRSIPPMSRSGFYGATVRPNIITAS